MVRFLSASDPQKPRIERYRGIIAGRAERAEGDLIAGSGNSVIATLVERQTRFVMPAKVSNKDSHSVIQALIKLSRKLPKELYRSLIWDRGTEMAGHRTFTLATDIDVFLCEPHSPWQRGSNENTNRLLRQYFPKRNRFVETSSGKVERRCKTAQRATSKDAGIRNTSGTF